MFSDAKDYSKQAPQHPLHGQAKKDAAEAAKRRKWMTAEDLAIAPHNRDALNMALYSPDNRFYISFLPSVKVANRAYAHLHVSLPENPTDQQTVLIDRRTTGPGNPLMYRYYTLPGDHRQQYEALIDKGWEACYSYYTNHKEQQGG